MPFFSIITPVYNSFDLMKPYFQSLKNQQFKDFEVVLIDDGSKDNSYEKLIKFQETSELMLNVLSTKKNSGPGFARNMGIREARGEWITFIDNDDWVSKDLLSKVKTTIDNHDTDCIVYDYFIQREGKEPQTQRSMIGEKGGELSTASAVMAVTNHTIGKFYKRLNCIDNDVFFPHLKRCEDVAFTTLAVSVSKKVFYIQEPMYYYFWRKGSLSNHAELGEEDMVKAYQIIHSRVESRFPLEIKEKSIRDLLYGAVLQMCKANKPNQEIKKYIVEYEKTYHDWWKCEMVRKVGRAKLLFLYCIRLKMISLLKFLSRLHTKIISH